METNVEQELRQGITALEAEAKVAKAEHESAFDRVHSRLDQVLSAIASYRAENKAEIKAAIAESEARTAERFAALSTLIVAVVAAAFTGIMLVVAILAYLGFNRDSSPPQAATYSHPTQEQTAPARPPATEAEAPPPEATTAAAKP